MSKSIHAGKWAAFALVAVFCTGTTVEAAAASTKWQQNHPRRTQVNSRLANQNARIKNEVAEGDMSKAKARRLHAADKGIRQEERDMAAQNGGHITKQEQRTLNQQENAVSKRIGK